MAARTLMLAGTGSDVGKSLIVTGLARAFARRGLRVCPFKPQNMSNNAAVTRDGGEIGRAQALQARAAGIEPSVHMNPVLLKPQSDTEAQLVVQGRVVGTAGARGYQGLKSGLLDAVIESYHEVARGADLVLAEGAGSVSEINLRAGDIANFGFARAGEVPVVLIGDIDRGGVIASLAGTKAVISPDDAKLVRGFLINKFRGDPALFADGMAAIAELTGWPGLGLIPYFPDALRLPAEDALALDALPRHAPGSGRPLVAVLAYRHVSNFDDFDPLRLEPGIDLVFLRPGDVLPGSTRLAILPGSKSTIADLKALRAAGWDVDLAAHIRRGGHVVGICGGYQMLGTAVHDPHGIEGPPQSVAGLGYLDVETTLLSTKTLREVDGCAWESGEPFVGYEMHVGETVGKETLRPLLDIRGGRPDGAVSADGRISGCYVHGLFAHEAQRGAWLRRIGAEPSGLDYAQDVDATLDRLADHIERHADCDRLLALSQVAAFPAARRG